ncbi:MAG: class I SAM-dependent methyltransferase [Chlamydiota bacterium]|nr:class I SAM-dependent methyltransferase [Chlamydiota bacterium]
MSLPKKNPLNIVSVEQQSPEPVGRTSQISRREEVQARYDRLWLRTPEKFNPNNSTLELDKIERTLNLIEKTIDLTQKKVADLGCGSGYLSRKLRDQGALVTAIDISHNALKELQKYNCQNITPVHDYIPKSLLPDDTFDVVIAADLIAHLNESEYRIFFSELARLVKAEGVVVATTSIDIHSENALQRFADLAATEFEILEWKFSYHSLFIRLTDIIKAPSRFIKASKDSNYRDKSLENRYSLGKWWFRLNSHKAISPFWRLIKMATTPLLSFLQSSQSCLYYLEKVSKFIWKESAISHAIMIGKRRSMMPNTTEEMLPKELKHKKQVWE